jgi:hypothetical protein
MAMLLLAWGLGGRVAATPEAYLLVNNHRGQTGGSMIGMHTPQSTLRRLRGAMALLALPLTFAISPAAAQQWTPQQRAACEPDAMRLCNQYLPDVQRTSACMSQYRRYLSPACRAVFQGGAKKKVRRVRR